MRGEVHVNFFQHRGRETLITDQDYRFQRMGGSA